MTINSAHVSHYRKQLREAPETAAALAQELDQGVKTAGAYTDPDLTAEALTNRRNEQRSTFLAEARERVPAYRAGFERARDYLLNEAKAHTRFPDDVATVVIATQKWSSIERMLDAGVHLRNVIDSISDVPTLLAIAEYGPIFAAAQAYREPVLSESLVTDSINGVVTGATDAGSWVQGAVWSRLAAVTTDAALSDLLNGAIEAEPLLAIADPMLQAAESIATHGGADMIAAHVMTGLAKQEHTARPDAAAEASDAA